MKPPERERRLGVKYIRSSGGAGRFAQWIGPYSGYTGYSLPDGGRVGKWSPKRKPFMCHSGWHAYVNTRPMRRWPPRDNIRRWFLVELEGPFQEDRGGRGRGRHEAKVAAARCRFIREITHEQWSNGMKTLRSMAKAAKDEGLL